MNINLFDIKTLFFDNKNIKQTIFKNTFWLGVAELIQGGIGFFISIWMARFFGPAVYGQWAFALSFVTLFSVFADFGFSTLTIRELARDKSKSAQYIDDILVMKLILGIITLGLIALFIQFLGKELEIVKLVYFLGIYTVLNTFASFFQSIFRANEKMEYETLCRIIQSISLLGLVAFFIFKKGSILIISYAYIGAALTGIIISLIAVWRYFSKFFLKVDFKTCKEILKEAWPFALSVFFSAIYFKIGTIILSILKNNQSVGFFYASYNLIMVIFLIPDYLSISVYPYFSQLFLKNKKILINSFFKLLKIFFFMGIIISFLIILLSPFLIRIIYGNEYQESINNLQILSVSIIFYFLAYFIGKILFSVNMQRYTLKIQFFSTIISIISNIILVFYFGSLGASFSFLISGIILTGGYFYFFNKYFIKINNI